MYTGGTSAAIKFIQKYKKTGHIVDFYSEEHVLSLDASTITIDDLKTFDRKYETRYRGHMLAVYIGDRNEEMLESLSRLYLPLRKMLTLNGHSGMLTHKPNFLLINLATKEILCVGLGRKNREFDFELHKYLANQTSNDAENKLIWTNDSSSTSDCSKHFFELDFYNIAETVILTTKSLGENYFEYDNLKGNADVNVTLNKHDGLYYLDDFDEEGMTATEVKELEQEYERRREWIADCVSELQQIFPKLEDWDLNTGDY